jgi:hypothetical protein
MACNGWNQLVVSDVELGLLQFFVGIHLNPTEKRA